ncbi:zinc ribbon domain-containing protein [Cohnella silvisoli]|uniref:PEGA domain-containing protein n=1 Tax=Cohnella silvisoli TaxID=2873699 RepID=A0ABV1KLZ5_9BACL|nr:hypothetical protein [Cohnella silvisoli]MCD9020565.1 hypothetical protein [Cohnella silvisoli]
MESDYAFCPECGASAAQDAEPQSQIEAAIPQSIPQSRKPMIVLSKKAKILIGSALLIVVLAVGAYLTGKYLTDENRLIDRFEKAVEDGNGDKLYDLLSASNKENRFDQKAADGIAHYLKSNPDALIQVTDQLKRQAKLLQSGDVEALGNADDVTFVYLHKKDKRRWLFYKDYELIVKRYMVPVQTNYEGAKILVDGKEVGAATGEESVIEVGPLLPGEYDMKAVYEGEYTTLENKQKVLLFPMESTPKTVRLELEGHYVNVYSNNNKARIFINGKDIGLVVADGQQIGPIVVDGSNKMYLEAEYPWGKMKSAEHPIDSDQMEVNMGGLNESAKEDIMASAHDFVTSWTQSLQEMDASKLKNASAEWTANISDYIGVMKANAQKYKGSINRMTFDLDSFVLIPLEDGGYSAQVNVQVDYSEITYYMEDKAPAPIDGTIYTSYELVYDGGRWLVSSWSSVNGIGTEHTKVYK